MDSNFSIVSDGSCGWMLSPKFSNFFSLAKILRFRVEFINETFKKYLLRNVFKKYIEEISFQIFLMDMMMMMMMMMMMLTTMSIHMRTPNSLNREQVRTAKIKVFVEPWFVYYNLCFIFSWLIQHNVFSFPSVFCSPYPLICNINFSENFAYVLN